MDEGASGAGDASIPAFQVPNGIGAGCLVKPGPRIESVTEVRLTGPRNAEEKSEEWAGVIGHLFPRLRLLHLDLGVSPSDTNPSPHKALLKGCEKSRSTCIMSFPHPSPRPWSPFASTSTAAM